jgi:hypothetical protein
VEHADHRQEFLFQLQFNMCRTKRPRGHRNAPPRPKPDNSERCGDCQHERKARRKVDSQEWQYDARGKADDAEGIENCGKPLN